MKTHITVGITGLLLFMGSFAVTAQKNLPQALETLINKAEKLYKQNAFKESNETYLQIIKTLDAQYKDYSGYNEVLIGCYSKLMGLNSRQALNNFPKMVAYANKAKQLLKVVKDFKEKGLTYYRLAIVAANQGDFKRTGDYLNQSLEVAQKTNDQDLYARVLTTLGRLMLNSSKYTEALGHFEKVERLYKELPETPPSSIANIYYLISGVYVVTYQHDKAVKYIQKQLDFAIKNFGKNSPQVLLIYTQAVVQYVNMRKPVEAKKYIDLMFAMDFPGIENQKFSMYNDLASVQLLENKHEEALKTLQKALEYSFKIYGGENMRNQAVYHKMSISYRKVKKFEEGLKAAQKAMMLNNRGFQPKNLEDYPSLKTAAVKQTQMVFLGERLYLEKEWYVHRKNVAYLQKARKTSQVILAQIKEWRANQGEEKNLQLFIKHFQYLFTRMLHVHLLLYQKTSERKYLAEAFEIMEQSKAYTLLRSLLVTSGSNQDAASILERKLGQQIKNLQAALTAEQGKKQPNKTLVDQYKDDIFTFKNSQDSLQSALKKYAPEYYQTRYRFDIASIDNIQQKLLQPNEMLVEYFLDNESSELFVFTVSPQAVDFKQIDTPTDFIKQVLNFRKSLTDNNFEQFTQIGHQLYKLLIADLPITANTQKLRIVPSGVLYYLPWEALLTQPLSGSSKNYQSLPYLLQKYIISYDYSATLMFNKRKQQMQPDRESLLAFSPDFKAQLALNQENKKDQLRNDIAPLKGAEAEVVALNKLYAGQLFMGKSATEYSFKNNLKNGSVIHLATHAIVDDGNPAYSRLLFSLSSQDTLNDGYLHAYELYNLKLNAELVTLSACNTGFGQISSGEGVMSLGRAFAYAGSPNVLMSLWSVPDQSTSKIMIAFYQNLASGMPKDIALQKAKLTYLESGDNLANNPFYWSSFVLIGDPKPLSLRPYTPFYLKSMFLWLVGLIVIGGGIFITTRRIS